MCMEAATKTRSPRHQANRGVTAVAALIERLRHDPDWHAVTSLITG